MSDRSRSYPIASDHAQLCLSSQFPLPRLLSDSGGASSLRVPLCIRAPSCRCVLRPRRRTRQRPAAAPPTARCRAGGPARLKHPPICLPLGRGAARSASRAFRACRPHISNERGNAKQSHAASAHSTTPNPSDPLPPAPAPRPRRADYPRKKAGSTDIASGRAETQRARALWRKGRIGPAFLQPSIDRDLLRLLRRRGACSPRQPRRAAVSVEAAQIGFLSPVQIALGRALRWLLMADRLDATPLGRPWRCARGQQPGRSEGRAAWESRSAPRRVRPRFSSLTLSDAFARADLGATDMPTRATSESVASAGCGAPRRTGPGSRPAVLGLSVARRGEWP